MLKQGRAKKCVLSFFRKPLRDDVCLMFAGSAFQARGPAITTLHLLLLVQSFTLNLRLGSSANRFLHRPFPFLPD